MLQLSSMYLSHTTIEELINKGDLVIEPDFDKKNIRPVGIRIHLGKEVLVPKEGQTISLTEAKDLEYEKIDLTKEEFYLKPNQFILGATYEAIKTPPDILAILDGRSTVARLGLTTHVTASIADGTFEKPHVIVLEIKNVGNFNVKLSFKDPIAMAVFSTLSTPVVKKIQSQYGAGQSGVTPPNLKFKTGTDN